MSSSSGCAWPTSVGMDRPQLAQTVRNVGFPSARHALPLLGMMRVPVSSHQVQLTRKARPDEELAAIAGAPEPPADVPAREPDALFSDPAEQGWSGRPDDPDVLERHEVIGVVCGHGTILLPESATSTRG